MGIFLVLEECLSSLPSLPQMETMEREDSVRNQITVLWERQRFARL